MQHEHWQWWPQLPSQRRRPPLLPRHEASLILTWNPGFLRRGLPWLIIFGK
jgi:hypothetical protein